jgi:hypothetical protein
MSTSKKHYIAVAAIIKKHYIPAPAAGFDEGYAAGVAQVAEELADLFAEDNPRFDRAEFFKACGARS